VKLFHLLPVATLLTIINCGGPQLTPEQANGLRQAQTRNLEVPYETVFKGCLGYLQDNYYELAQASKDSYFIHATKLKSKNTPGMEAFWAGVKKNDYIGLNITFDAIDDQNTIMRVNITTTRDKGSVGFMYGGLVSSKSTKDVKPVVDPDIYKAFNDGLTREILKRHLSNQMRQKK